MNAVIVMPLLVLSGCVTQQLSGTYTTYSKSGMLMAGRTIDFDRDSSVVFRIWSDDLAGNKEGSGKYSLNGNTLIITFDEPVIHKTVVNEILTDKSDNNSHSIRIETFDKLSRKPLVGVTLSLMNTQTRSTTYGVTDAEGLFDSFTIPAGEDTLLLKTSYLGMREVEHGFTSTSSMEIEIQMVHKTNYFKAGEVLKYRYQIKGKKLKLIRLYDDGRERRHLLIRRE